MSSSNQAASSVTHGELVTNVKYGYWFNYLCERLYVRLDFVLNAVQLVGGSAAAFGVMQSAPGVSATAGVLLAGAAAASLLVQPAIKAERHRRAKCDYMLLEAQAWRMAFDDLNQALTKVRADAPTGMDVLSVPAYNATLRAIGESSTLISETWVQRLARALA